MAARSSLRALGLVPGAASLQLLLDEFRLGGPGVVCALNSNLLQSASALVDEDDDVLEPPVGLAELVKRILTLCDESPRSLGGGALLVTALAKATEDLDAQSPYAASAKFPGFHKAAAETLQALMCRVEPDRLDESAEEAAPETAAKMRSLAALEREIRRTLEALNKESLAQQMLRCFECKPSSSAKLIRTLVLGGSESSPLIARWIKWLSECGVDVTVALDAPIPESGLFGGSILFARELGVLIEGRGEPSDLCSVLFTERTSDGLPRVEISSCSDALAEAEWALRGCQRDIRNGLSVNEIGIYARNLDDYATCLESAAKRLDIPLKMSRRAPILTNRFARLALETLQFCASDDPRLLIPVLGCSYLGLDRKLAAEVKAQAQTAYKARKNAWPVMAGFAQKESDRIPWLARILAWREEALKSALPLFTWNDRFRTLVSILPWHGPSGEGPSQARDIRVQTAMRRAIANVASVGRVTQERPIDLREFVRVCGAIWEDEDYTIPAGQDGIAVVASAQRLGPIKSLYALGMLEGVFPRRRSEDPILNDEDLNEISRVLALDPPLPTSFDRAREERDEFYRLCAAAEDSITLSYPQTDETRDNVPAFYLQEIQRAMPHAVLRDYPRVPFAPLLDECVSQADIHLRQAFDSPREEPLPVHFLTKELRDDMAWPSDRPFTPQDLRSVLQCEFKHFASRRIGVKPRWELGRWSGLRRLPRNVRLMEQADQESALRALETALEAELDELYGEAPPWELSLMRSGGRRLISEWVKREFTARQLWPKEPNTLKLDLPFGAPGIRNRMPGEVALEGTIAASSGMGPYAVTHLYESQAPEKGSNFGGPLAELDTLYYGLHLLARYGQREGTAVEVESMSGERTLLLMPRLPQAPMASNQQAGLHVIDLATAGEGRLAQKAFFDEVKRRLKRAVSALQQSGIEPMPGKHCSFCGFGELCRRSQDFSEETSPFGADERDFEAE